MEKETRELVILTHYVSIGSKSPQATKLLMDQYREKVLLETKNDPHYRFKHFILPVKESKEQRVECIFPSNNKF